ncbi:MAG: aminotransferase class I/II-fold pyridoxal phosphate-dependent enzyme [Acidobacteria bacterium]|nr:aminotransferase class I/II-fold pyridoxal phosphate-dependent enzyme [Acidobacteriota bacterium]
MTEHWKRDTRVIHEGEGASSEALPVSTPIYQTTTFLFESGEAMRRHAEEGAPHYIYSRDRNPTVEAAERKMATLEGAEAALVFSSGQAATTATLMGLVSAGDEVVCSGGIYGGTLRLLRDVLARFGVRTRFVSLDDVREPTHVLSDTTRVVWFETPVNPTLRCVDIRQVADACRACGVVSVVDSTFASPANQQPLALGVDLVMHSASKYLAGHSDLTAGAIAGPHRLVDRVAEVRSLVGGVLDPQAAFALARSLKTLSVRMARHNANAAAAAAFLASHPRVSRVLYPGLASHPDRDVAERQMQGFGGMVTFDVDGRLETALAVYDRLRVFQRAASLGGVESLCSLPVLTSQVGYSDEELARAGVTRGMLRLSVGLEDPDDLVADLAQALG